MKKFGKKTLALLLALMMVLSLMSVTALAGNRDTSAQEDSRTDEPTAEETASSQAIEKPAEVAKNEVVTAQAEDDGWVTFGEYHVNPLYADVITTDDLREIEPAEPSPIATYSDVAYTDIESAGAYVRGEMVARNQIIEVNYLAAETLDDQAAEDIGVEIFDEAFAHTGVGNEGDYLAYQYGGWHIGYGYAGNYLYLIYILYYFTDAEQEAAVTEKVDEVLSSLACCESDYQKLCEIYEYICNNVTYDYDHLSDRSYWLQYSAYGALINGTSVCQGYATLFYRMALDAGIDCRVMVGLGGGGDHAWNIVKLGDCWYDVDTTWDSAYNADTGDWAYFLKCENNFPNHIREPEYQTDEFNALYPMAETDYDPETATEGNETHHEPGDWEVVTPANCTEPGLREAFCIYCGTLLASEEIPETGHMEVVDEAMEPTCGESGLTEGSHCSVCGEVLSEQEEIPATGEHVWDEGILLRAADYESEGGISYTCTVCGATEIVTLPIMTPGLDCENFAEGITVTAVATDPEQLDAYYLLDVSEAAEEDLSDDTVAEIERAVLSDPAADGKDLTLYYLNFTLLEFKTSEEAEQVDKIGTGIEITVSVPDTLLNADDYLVVQMHAGEGTVLESKWDPDENTLTFTTNLFSLYAIVALNEPIDNDNEDSEEPQDPDETVNGEEDESSPDESDDGEDESFNESDDSQDADKTEGGSTENEDSENLPNDDGSSDTDAKVGGNDGSVKTSEKEADSDDSGDTADSDEDPDAAIEWNGENKTDDAESGDENENGAVVVTAAQEDEGKENPDTSDAQMPYFMLTLFILAVAAFAILAAYEIRSKQRR